MQKVFNLDQVQTWSMDGEVPVVYTLFDDGSTDSRQFITFRTKVLVPWSSTLPPLTVPDLADTVEQMFQRRASGISDNQPAALMMRTYPTDPHSIKTAQEMLVDLKSVAQTELETVNKQIATTKAERAKGEKQAAKDKEAFDNFLSDRKKQG